MSELTISQLIKIIIGVIVFLAVVVGLYSFFKDSVFDFFNNMVGNGTSKFILGILNG